MLTIESSLSRLTLLSATHRKHTELHEIKWNANLMQLGNFFYVFLARHISGK